MKLTWDQVRARPQIRLYAGDLPQRLLQQSDLNLVGLSTHLNDGFHLKHPLGQALPLPDGAVAYFQAEDVFEHIAYDALPAILVEIHRVLAPGARFRLSVPDYGCDVLAQRSERDTAGRILFDPGGGGTREKPGHLWFPRLDSVAALLADSPFRTMDYLHYYRMDGTAVLHPIDHAKGLVVRTPDFDARVQNPNRPMSLVVDLFR